MPATALKILKDGVEQRLIIMTVSTPTGVDVDISLADENFMPTGTLSIGVDSRREDDYHKELRIAAKEKGQLMSEYSTNPEWNPGYKEPTEEATEL